MAGPLKGALINAVYEKLLSFDKHQTLINGLNHPQNGDPKVRAAWAELKEKGATEGMKKTTGLQACLSERPDLFHFYTNEKGHNFIQLADTFKAMQNAAPAPEPAAAGPVGAIAAMTLSGSIENMIQQASKPLPVSSAGTAGPLTPGFLSAETASAIALLPAQKKISARRRKMDCEDFFGGKWGHIGYTDIVWTPDKQVQKDAQLTKVNGFIRAIFNAINLQPTKSTSLAQLGSDFKVAELKKDPFFHSWKVREILEDYSEVFITEMQQGISGGVLVRLQPDAKEKLPDAATFDERDSADFFLPLRLEFPRTVVEKAQCLRIEMIHALHRRGGKCQIQELGQDALVQKAKSENPQKMKLLDWVRGFSDNFLCTMDGVQPHVELFGMDVCDISVVERLVLKNAQTNMAKGKGGGRYNLGVSMNSMMTRQHSHHSTQALPVGPRSLMPTGYQPPLALPSPVGAIAAMAGGFSQFTPGRPPPQPQAQPLGAPAADGSGRRTGWDSSLGEAPAAAAAPAPASAPVASAPKARSRSRRDAPPPRRSPPRRPREPSVRRQREPSRRRSPVRRREPSRTRRSSPPRGGRNDRDSGGRGDRGGDRDRRPRSRSRRR